MSHSNKTLKSVSWAVGATLATTLAASNIASAATPASDNPFAMSELDSGYMLLAEKDSEGKCGEGKCGEGKSEKKDKGAEGKCGEGKCGSN